MTPSVGRLTGRAPALLAATRRRPHRITRRRDRGAARAGSPDHTRDDPVDERHRLHEGEWPAVYPEESADELEDIETTCRRKRATAVRSLYRHGARAVRHFLPWLRLSLIFLDLLDGPADELGDLFRVS